MLIIVQWGRQVQSSNSVWDTNFFARYEGTEVQKQKSVFFKFYLFLNLEQGSSVQIFYLVY